MNKIGVVGGGLMGLGIACVFCCHKKNVYVYEASLAQRETLIPRLQKLLLDDGHDVSLAENLTVLNHLEDMPENVDIVFEAGPEKLDIKQAIFQQLSHIVSKTTILASNTSVIPITDIASAVDEISRERVIGTHWWNPAHLIPLVEVIRTSSSSNNAMTQTYALLEAVGKKPVYVEKDVTGFIGNRLQHALWREAQALIANGVCSPETIDVVVKNSFGMRLPVFGPIENADMVGLDLTFDIHNVVLKDLDNASAPLPSLTERIANNQLGVKTGQGFLSWDDDKKQALQQKLNQHIRLMLKNNQGETQHG